VKPPRPFSACLALTLSLALLAAPALALPQLRIDAPSEVDSLLGRHLALARALNDSLPPDAGQLEALRQDIDNDARSLLATEGYFSPRVRLDRQDEQWTLYVEPGPRTRIGKIALQIDGPGGEGPAGAERLRALREAWSLNQDAPFRQDDWDAAKRQALRAVQIDQYPTARWASTEARIDPDQQRAELLLTLASGPAFTLGPIQVHGLKRYPAEAVTRLAGFTQGTPYHQRWLLDYQAALQATPYFQSVRVEAELNLEQPWLSPVHVYVQEAPKQKISVGAGYGSDSGPRGSLGYQHHNVAGLGVLFASTLQLERDQQTLDASLTLPRDGDGYRDIAGVKLAHSEVQQLLLRQETVYASRLRARGDDEHGYGLTFTRERSTPDGGDTSRTQALVARYDWTRRRVDSLLNPQRGHMLAAQLVGASRYAGSDTDFLRAYARAIGFYPLDKQARVILRGEIGQVWAARANDVPIDWRFRTGGGGSVRGYAYQSLGPREAGAVTGGRVLALASAEYQHPVGPPGWRLALFADAGNASDRWQDWTPRLGLGAGLRWDSPIGPVGLDIARGQYTKQWQWNLSLGASF